MEFKPQLTHLSSLFCKELNFEWFATSIARTGETLPRQEVSSRQYATWFIFYLSSVGCDKLILRCFFFLLDMFRWRNLAKKKKKNSHCALLKGSTFFSMKTLVKFHHLNGPNKFVSWFNILEITIQHFVDSNFNIILKVVELQMLT